MWNLLEFKFVLQKFRVDLFSEIEEFFSQLGKNSEKSAKINLREN